MQPQPQRRLVEFEEIDIVHREASPLERHHRGPARLGEQRGVGTGNFAIGNDLGERFDPERIGPGFGRDHRGGAAVRDLAGVPGGDIAGAPKRPLQAGERLGGSADPDAFIVTNDDVVAAPLRNGDRHDLFGEKPSFCARAALVRHRRVGIHRFTGHAVGGCVPLGAGPHEFVFDRAVEAIEGERVVERGVAVAVARSGLGQHVGRVGHRLHAAGHHDLRLARGDHAVEERSHSGPKDGPC